MNSSNAGDRKQNERLMLCISGKPLVLNRRQLLQATFAGLVGHSVGRSGMAQTSTEAKLPKPLPSRLPRWRGFNLLEKFTKRDGGNPPFKESDFEWIAAFGFNFVRL